MSMANKFSGIVELFPQDKGWFYVRVPQKSSKPYEKLTDRGLIAVTALVGKSSWNTSLLPYGDGTHFIALLAKVRAKEKIALGGKIEVDFSIRKRARK
ncbi:protein DUF1905 [Candidatus Termititenax aidoneus]|uniref:Protein DUF1905 n=1 Tax=Termititenax aidoneus TaxID=2218524 RepID=A0A388TBB8_TERA1|nr:protein DUF1905 [Candidatus Termititenax aidoneus]